MSGADRGDDDGADERAVDGGGAPEPDPDTLPEHAEDDTGLDEIEAGVSDPFNDAEVWGRKAGHALGRACEMVLGFIGGFIVQFLTVALRITPFGAKFWRGLWLTALHKYHKRVGGDAVGLERTPSGLRPTPIKWREALDELQNEPGWKAKGRDKTWEEAPSGDEQVRLGKTPVVPLATDAPRAGSMFDSQVAAAVDKGNMRPLYNVEQGRFEADISYPSGPAPAMADGGQAEVAADFHPTDTPLFEDMIVDLGHDEGVEGTAISFDAYSDLLQETTTSEQMKLQQERGYLAGMDVSDRQAFMMKVLLIGAAVAVAGLIGPELVTALFNSGGSGGGGGSVMPFLARLSTLGVV